MFRADRSRSAAAILAGVLLVGFLPAVALADGPDAVDDTSYSVLEDSSANSLDVLANDTDSDLDPLTITDATDPAHGTASTDGSTVNYVPDLNFAGVDTFDYSIDDGNGGVDTATVTVTVDQVNDAPSGANDTVTTREDDPYTFSAADFGFTDAVEGDAFLSVKIATVPGSGSLTDDSATVSAGDFVSKADLDGGKLTFTPAANAEGAGYASFTFQVRDDGGTLNGGIDLDPTANTITIDVTDVNDAPAGTDGAVGTHENAPYVFVATDFGFTDPADSPPDAFLGTVIVTLPGVGTLKDDGIAVTAGQFIPIADITGGKLVFTPVNGQSGAGYATLTFAVRDAGGTSNGGANTDATANTITINVGVINHAPAGTNKTVTTVEDVPDTLVTSDFGFTDSSDSPPNSLLGVKVTTLPGAGVLRDNGTAVTAGQTISASDIAGNKLVFTPAANANGSPHATFTFQVQDDGGTADGGIDLDQSANTITVNVTASNDAPAGTDKHVSTGEDTAVTLVAADFGFTDVNDSPANALTAVKITTLPTAGSLKDNTVSVTVGQVIPVADLNANKLVFTPATNGNGTPYATFTFQVQDNGGTSNGGSDLDPTPNTITLDVSGTNDPPNAANDAGMTVPESAGATSLAVKSNDTDPDGDTLTIVSTTNGAHGTVAILAGGTGLTYNPDQLYIGTDVFTYTVSDGHGHTDPATVLVTVVKDTTKPTVIAPAETFHAQTVGTSTAVGYIVWSATDPGGTGVASYKLQVSVNGGSYTTITLPKATSTSISRTHTNGKSYRYRVRATDKQGNVSAYAYGPTFKLGRIQEANASIAYVGTWTANATKKASGGSHRVATASTATATLTTTVRDIGLIVTKTSLSGTVEVWVDGSLATTLNLHSSTTKFRQLVFSKHFSSVSTHVIQLRVLGTGRVYLDGFVWHA